MLGVISYRVYSLNFVSIAISAGNHLDFLRDIKHKLSIEYTSYIQLLSENISQKRFGFYNFLEMHFLKRFGIPQGFHVGPVLLLSYIDTLLVIHLKDLLLQ